jgi:hypothetical protein
MAWKQPSDMCLQTNLVLCYLAEHVLKLPRSY